IHRLIRLSGLILPPCAAIGKPGRSSLGLPGAQVGDGRTFQARNADFAFIRTHLSLGFRSSAWIGEPFMPALDQAAPAVSRQARDVGKEAPRDAQHELGSAPECRGLGSSTEGYHATLRLHRGADISGCAKEDNLRQWMRGHGVGCRVGKRYLAAT